MRAGNLIFDYHAEARALLHQGGGREEELEPMEEDEEENEEEDSIGMDLEPMTAPSGGDSDQDLVAQSVVVEPPATDVATTTPNNSKIEKELPVVTAATASSQKLPTWEEGGPFQDTDSSAEDSQESVQFHSFDYGDLQSQPDMLLSTLETNSELWSSPARPYERVDQALMEYIQPIEVEPANPIPVMAQSSKYSQHGYYHTILESYPRSIRLPPAPAYKIVYHFPWLVALLTEIHQKANRLRLLDQPRCWYPQFLYRFLEAAPVFDGRLLKLHHADHFAVICCVSPDWHFGILEPNRVALESSRAVLPKPLNSSIRCRPVGEYQYSLLNMIQDKDGAFPEGSRLGTRMNRRETLKREFGAIVPYAKRAILSPEEEGDRTGKSVQLWNVALIVGYCAWQYHESLIQYPENSSAKLMGEVKGSKERPQELSSRDSLLTPFHVEHDLHPFSAGAENEEVERPLDTTSEPVVKKRSKNRRKKRRSQSTDLEAKKCFKTAEAPDSGSGRSKDKTRKRKLRAKEASLLQRFGLSITEDTKEQFLEDNFLPASSGDREGGILFKPTESQQMTTDLGGPPLRCGSPSLLDSKLKRKKSPPSVEGRCSAKSSGIVESVKRRRAGTVNSEVSFRELSAANQEECHGSNDNASFYEVPGFPGVASDDESEMCRESPAAKSLSPLKPSTLSYEDLAPQSPMPTASTQFCDGVSMATTPDDKPLKHLVRGSPIVYDDQELSDRARLMLQAMEDGRDPIHLGSSLDVDSGMNPNERVVRDAAIESRSVCAKTAGCVVKLKETEVTSLSSNKEKKRLRKEAKKKRKKEKKRKKKEKRAIPNQEAAAADVLTPIHPPEYSTSPPCNPVPNSQGCDDVANRAEFAISSALRLTTNPPEEADVSVFKSSGQENGIVGLPPVKMFCSESFLEQWGGVVAMLASGKWNVDMQCNLGAPIQRRIFFLDTVLVDTCGVDIETPGRGAIMIFSISTIRQSGTAPLLKQVLEVVSRARYKTLEIFICADIPVDTVVVDITRLESAILRQKGQPKTVVSFRLTSQRSVSGCIAESIMFWADRDSSVLNFDAIEKEISNQKTVERLLFLITLVPSLSLGGALFILFRLGDQPTDDESGSWFRQLLSRTVDSGNRLESNSDGQLSPHAFRQISFALSTPLGNHV